MNTHKTFFGKILALDFNGAWSDLKNWLKEIWDNADHNILHAAIQVTEAAKDALLNKTVQSLVSFTTTKMDDAIYDFLQKNILNLLAGEFLIDGIKLDSTEAEIQTVATKVVDLFGGLNDADKEQLYTSVAANAYRLYQDVKAGKKITFGEAAALVEGFFKQKD